MLCPVSCGLSLRVSAHILLHCLRWLNMRKQWKEGLSSRDLSRIMLVGYHCVSLSFFRMFLSFVLYHIVPSLISFGGEKLLLCFRSSQVLKQPLALPFFQSMPTFDIHIALLHFWFSAIAKYVHSETPSIKVRRISKFSIVNLLFGFGGRGGGVGVVCFLLFLFL